MDNEKAQRVLGALDSGEISEAEARSLLEGLKGQTTKEVADERHPAISFKDRALYKNFAVDPEQGRQFLAEKYPELEFQFDNSGDMIVKGQSDKKWKKLDPGSFDLEDISDIAYDVPAGLLEGIAAAGGGVAGGTAGLAGGPAAPVTVPLGAAAGAASAGAGTAAATEGVRQSLGKYFGVAKEYDPEQIKLSAAFGAGAPLLMGTGAAAKQVAKQVAKKGLSKEASEQLLKGQSGVIGHTYRGTKQSIAPKIGQMASGVDQETIKWASKNLDKIKDAEDAYGQVAIYGELADGIQMGHLGKKEAAGQAYGEALDNLDVMVDVGDAEKPLHDLLAKYETRSLELIDQYGDDAVNKVDFQNYQYLQKKIGEYARNDGMLHGAEAQRYLGLMNDLTGVRKSTTPGAMEVIDRELMNAAKQVTKNVDDAIAGQATGDAFKQAKREYAKTFAREKDIKKYFKDEEATERTLNGLMSPKKNAKRKKVMQLAEDVDQPIDEAARESIATSIFSRPSEEALSLGGVTSTSRAIPAAAAGTALGYYGASQLGEGHGTGVAGAVLGGMLAKRFGSPAAMRRIMQSNQGLNKTGGAVQNFSPMGVPVSPQNAAQIWQNIEQNRR